MKMVIDTAEQANEFMPRFLDKYAIVLPIGTDTEKHPLDNKLCCLYIRFLDSELTSVIVPYNHDESIGIYPWFHQEFGRNNKAIFTLDKKQYQHYLGRHQNLYDLQLFLHMFGDGPVELEKFMTSAHRQILNMNSGRPDLNRSIPLVKHLEWGDAVTDSIIPFLKENKDKILNEGFVNTNGIVLDSLYEIERYGMKVAVDEIALHYPRSVLKYVSDDGFVFTNYNALTSTGRPSNAFGKVNFAAINKNDGSRKAFVSRFEDGELVYIDFESYHLRLLADFLSITIDSELPLHEYFGRIYFGKDNLTRDEYEESKRITFQSLYGRLTLQTEALDFFQRVNRFVNTLWSGIQTHGFMKTPIYKRKILLDEILDPNPQKVFNYFLQAYETEANIQIIRQLLQMNGDDRLLVLYLYDGFLFDVKSGLKMDDVVAVMERGGKFPVRVYRGKTFNDVI